jgi:citrate lyase beta subunit
MTSTSTANLPLTYLFVPGNRADRHDKALGTSAGAIIIDFEDAVSPADKDAIQVDGKMVDRPVIVKAQRILART